MSSDAIRAGKAYVEIHADGGPLARGLKAARAEIASVLSAARFVGSTSMSAIGSGMSAVGGGLAKVGSAGLSFLKSGMPSLASMHSELLMVGSGFKWAAGAGVAAAGSLAYALYHFAEAGGALDDMSQRTGASVEALGGLKYAAELAGSSGETLEKSLHKMGGTIQEAAGGSAGAQEKLAALGLTVADLAGLQPEQQFAAIADGIAAIEDPAARTAAAMDVLGKGGVDLVPMLADGSAGLEVMAQRAEELGLIMSGEDAAAAAALGDSFDDLKSTIGSVVNEIGAAFAPAAKAIFDTIRMGVKLVKQWVAENRELIGSLTDFLGGIRDALSAGDLELAGRILWLGLKNVWLAGINALMEPWTAWKTSFQQTAAAAFFGVLHIANEVWAKLRTAMNDTIGFITKAWAKTVNWTAQRVIDVQEKAGILSKQEAAGAREELTAMGEQKQNQLESDRLNKAKEIQDDRQKREEELAKANIEADKTIAAANKQAMQESLDEQNRVRSELKDLMAQAAAKRKDLPAVKAKTAAELADGVQAARTSVTGTFSAFGLGQIGSDAPIKQVADNTKKTADATVAMAKDIKDIKAAGPAKLKVGT